MPRIVDPAPVQKRFYSIRLGSFKDRENAQERVDELTRLGHNAFCRFQTVKGKGKWYRVFIERYDSREQAEKEARILKELGLISEYGIEALTDETAPKTTKEAEQIQKQTFHLHVNSFQSRDNAEAETGRLTRLGYQAFLREEDVSGQVWFRVYVGAFPSEKDAREQGEILKGKGVIGYFKPLRFEMK
jgi:cell division septation protein DedD